MNSYINTMAIMIIPVTFSLLTGCTTMGRDLVRVNAVKLEKISSSNGAISHVSVYKKGNEATLRGEVRSTRTGRGSIPGHIDIEVIDPSGDTLEQTTVSYTRFNLRSQYAQFDSKLEKIPPTGSIIRVIHHNAVIMEHCWVDEDSIHSKSQKMS